MEEKEKRIETIKNALRASISYIEATVEYKDPDTGKRVTKPRYSPEDIKTVLDDENFVINEIIAGNWARTCEDYIPEDILRAHPIYYAKMVEKEPEFLHSVPEDIKEQNPEICLNALKKDGWLLHSVPYSVQEQHPQDVLEAVRKSHLAIQFVSPEIQGENQNFIMAMIKEDSGMIRYVEPSILYLNMYTLIDYMETDMRENTGNPQFAYSALRETLGKYYKDKGLELPPKVANLIKRGQMLRNQYVNKRDAEYRREARIQEAQESKEEEKVGLPAYQGFFEKTKGRLKEIWSNLKNLISRDKGQQDKDGKNPEDR